jgi:hypothetical protein
LIYKDPLSLKALLTLHWVTEYSILVPPWCSNIFKTFVHVLTTGFFSLLNWHCNWDCWASHKYLDSDQNR